MKNRTFIATQILTGKWPGEFKKPCEAALKNADVLCLAAGEDPNAEVSIRITLDANSQTNIVDVTTP